jgi:transcription elongation factor Elf1
MVEFSKIMRKARVDKSTQTVFCPNCDKSNFNIFRKEPLDEGKIYLHHAKCKDCGLLFVFKANL